MVVVVVVVGDGGGGGGGGGGCVGGGGGGGGGGGWWLWWRAIADRVHRTLDKLIGQRMVCLSDLRKVVETVVS
jgi:hypothetical protein